MKRNKKTFYNITLSFILWFILCTSGICSQVPNINPDIVTPEDISTFITEDDLNKFIQNFPVETLMEIGKVIEPKRDVLRHLCFYNRVNNIENPTNINPDMLSQMIKIKETYYLNSAKILQKFDMDLENLVYSYVLRYWGEQHLEKIKKYAKFNEIIGHIANWLALYPDLVKNHPNLRYYDEKNKIEFTEKAKAAMLVPLKEKYFFKYYLSILIVEAGFMNYRSRAGAVGAFQIWKYPLNKPISEVEKGLLKKFGIANTDKWEMDIDHQIYWSLFKTARPLAVLYDTPLTSVSSKANKTRLIDFKNLINKSLNGENLTAEDKIKYYTQNIKPASRQLGLYDYLMAIYNGGSGSITYRMYGETIRYLSHCGTILGKINELEQFYLSNLNCHEKTDMSVVLTLRNNPELIKLFYPFYKDFINFLWTFVGEGSTVTCPLNIMSFRTCFGISN